MDAILPAAAPDSRWDHRPVTVYGLEAHQIHPLLSFEVELMKTLTDGESTYPSVYGNTKVEASAFGFGGYAVASYDQLPIENLVPYVRLGLAYTSVDVSAGNSLVNVSGEASDFGLAYSLGLRYEINSQFGALVDFTSTEVDVLNAGIQYNF